MKLISVLMSSYNSERWINKSIQSLLAQSYNELQIVIVDDGSTDRTKDIIRSIKDSRIELYEREHRGISSALNYGLEKSAGELIVKADSDDLFLPDRIEIQSSFIRNNPEYGVVGSNFIVVDENESEIMKVRYPEKNIHIKDQLPRKCCVAHGTLLMRKEILTQVNGYNESLKTAEDWDLYLRIINKTKFYNIQKYLTLVRKHDKNITNNSFCRAENMKVPAAYFEKNIKNAQNRKEKAKLYFDLGYHYYYEDELSKSIVLFNEAVKLHPLKLQFQRYYLTNRYLKDFLLKLRRSRFIKVLDLLRRLDRNNIIFRNKF